MTTRAAAIKAAHIFAETQPAIDALKDVMSANAEAKKILGLYMTTMHLNVFRGVEMKVAAYSGWDMDKVKDFLGDKVSKCRRPMDRKTFSLRKLATRA